nr:MAG TPA: hypothetical protein [Caudoviricetes sp.]
MKTTLKICCSRGEEGSLWVSEDRRPERPRADVFTGELNF